MFQPVLKWNPFHDLLGKFASKGNAAWTKTSPQKGSNPGGVYSYKGKSHYVKFPKNEGQVHAEVAADKIHELMGIESMQHSAKTINGKVGSVSEWKDVVPLGRKGWDRLTPTQVQQAANAYVASALTKNWDVVGLVHDNMGTTKQGNLAIIDTGGSFHFRAQGEHKDFGGDPTPELKAMLSPEKTSGRVFGPLAKEYKQEFFNAAQRLKSIPDKALLKAVAGMGHDPQRDKELLARKQGILDFFGI